MIASISGHLTKRASSHRILSSRLSRGSASDPPKRHLLLSYPERVRRLIKRKFLGEHQCDLRQFDAEWINVQSEKLLWANYHGVVARF